jgi:hypothetical protein
VIEERLLIFQLSERFSPGERAREIGLDDVFSAGSWFGDRLSQIMLEHKNIGLTFCESAVCIILDQNLLVRHEEILRFNEFFFDRLDLLE